jgi:hypothetical protein
MSEKPQKRLVSKGRYAWLMAVRAVLVSIALVCILIGLFFTRLWLLMPHSIQGEPTCTVGILASICGGTYFLSFRLFKKERTIERVLPITKHTTSFLPPKESLVRASDMPPSHQQAELLRAAQMCHETPPEELLRAGQENRHEDGARE